MGRRHGRRRRRLTGTFGPTEIVVPRARLVDSDGATSEWRSAACSAGYCKAERPCYGVDVSAPHQGFRRSSLLERLASPVRCRSGPKEDCRHGCY